MNTFIFLRHAQTAHDSTKNAADWVLSEKGYQDAKNLININDLNQVDLIFTSSEVKAFLTAKPLADFLNVEITQIGDFDEVRRSDKFFTDEEFLENKKKQLEDFNFPAFGGETCNEALLRFNKALKKIDEEFSDKRILIVSHGTILTAFFARKLEIFDNLNSRWQQTPFCAFGIIQNNEIIKDIIN